MTSMDEPAGRTIDGTPWEEARGPHLPDRLTRFARRLPWAAWIFVGLAIANGVILTMDGGLSQLSDPAVDRVMFVRLVLGSLLALVPPITTMLFGAALFVRHPRAWTTHRVLAIGLIVLTVSETMATLTRHLSDVFLALTPLSDDYFITYSEIAYSASATILVALGTAAVARGLVAARKIPAGLLDSRRGRVVVTAAILLAVWSIVVNVVLVLRFTSQEQDLGAIYIVQAWLTTVLQWFVLAAATYLALVAYAGMAAVERPIRAWRFAAAGAWSILALGNGVAVAIDGAMYAVATPQTDFSAWSWVYLLPAAGWALGSLLLLFAFASGLPSEEDAAPA